ncbi:unnamed protein product [Caenorhabditis angaria]|uniref:Uncharacterized protein n=1 Tax=Caenorhabditis angaria TaxID=860376 RepID=A0A9P1IDX4_9PELO|nr:unnamed protein product [Caenorhabditis angaria]
MTVEVFRKKAHAPPQDDEDWCPKRKIKRLVVEKEKVPAKPTHQEAVFNNIVLVSKIFDLVVADEPILNFLDWRRVNRSFGSACLHKVRKDFRHLQVVASAPDGEGDVEINEISIDLVQVAKLFGFLRRIALIQIETIEFAGFVEDNKLIHDCILHELFAFSAVHVRSYKGADEICEAGCMMCYILASQSHIYGPMQWLTLQKGFDNQRHFQHLLITEILITQIAMYCLEMVESGEKAMEIMKLTIGQNVACDVLEIIVSDRLMISQESPTHPRNVIDCIVKQWKPKSVKLKFMTGYSSLDCSEWTNKHIFDELRFDSNKLNETWMRHSEKLQSLEIDLTEGDAIAECLLEVAAENVRNSTLFSPPKPNRKYSMEHVCSNVKKIFPTDRVFVSLPLALHQFARDEFGIFCRVLMSFVWNDTRVSRNSQIFVRVFCAGINKTSIQKAIEPAYSFHGRPIVTFPPTFTSMLQFAEWHPDICMRNFSPIFHITFQDLYNNCAVHLEVCVEKEEETTT